MAKVYNMASRRFYEIEDVLRGTAQAKQFPIQAQQLLDTLGNRDYYKVMRELLGKPISNKVVYKGKKYSCFKPSDDVRLLAGKDLISFQVRKLTSLRAWELWVEFYTLTTLSCKSN